MRQNHWPATREIWISTAYHDTNYAMRMAVLALQNGPDTTGQIWVEKGKERLTFDELLATARTVTASQSEYWGMPRFSLEEMLPRGLLEHPQQMGLTLPEIVALDRWEKRGCPTREKIPYLKWFFLGGDGADSRWRPVKIPKIGLTPEEGKELHRQLIEYEWSGDTQYPQYLTTIRQMHAMLGKNLDLTRRYDLRIAQGMLALAQADTADIAQALHESALRLERAEGAYDVLLKNPKYDEKSFRGDMLGSEVWDEPRRELRTRTNRKIQEIIREDALPTILTYGNERRKGWPLGVVNVRCFSTGNAQATDAFAGQTGGPGAIGQPTYTATPFIENGLQKAGAATSPEADIEEESL